MSSSADAAASVETTSSAHAAPPSTPPPSVRKHLHLSPFSTPSLNRSLDRFIPRRDAQDLDVSGWLLRKQSQGRTPPDATDATDKSNRELRYQQEIASRLLDADGPAGHGGPNRVGAGCVTVGGSGGVLSSGAGATPRVLNFGSPHGSPAKGGSMQGSTAHEAINALHSKMSTNESLKRKTKRAIPTAPERVLDAPGLLNDYYLNLVDWNCKNILAVALDKTVYLWNAATREIQELLTLDHDNYISSLSYVKENGHLLAVGTSNHNVEIWDTVKIARTRVMSGHMARVGSLAWRGQILTSGSKDTSIINHDPRASSHIVSTYHSHKQEVCGLAWNGDGLTLASGGNDNLLALWDIRRQNSGETAYYQPTHCCTEHLAAVKALVRLGWLC
jgi:WD40 repeat protein